MWKFIVEVIVFITILVFGVNFDERQFLVVFALGVGLIMVDIFFEYFKFKREILNRLNDIENSIEEIKPENREGIHPWS